MRAEEIQGVGGTEAKKVRDYSTWTILSATRTFVCECATDCVM